MRKPQKRSLATREKILKVAREQVAAQGYEAVRTDEIVKAAGVAKGTLFAHFGDKDQLLKIMIGEEFSGVISSFVGLLNKPNANSDEFFDLLAQVFHFLSRERIIFTLFQFAVGVSAEATNDPIQEDCDELLALLAAVIEKLQKTHEVRTDVTAADLSEGCLAFLMQAVSFKLCGFYGNIDQAEAGFRNKLSIWLLLK